MSGPVTSSLTFLLVGGVLTAIGIILLLLAFLSFMFSVISFGLDPNRSFGMFGTSLFGLIVVGAFGVALTSVGGFLLHFWWIWLIVGDTGRGNTRADRDAARDPAIRVRCRSCGRLNPEFVVACMACGKPV